MTTHDHADVIPRPSVVRDRLAEALQQARLLRRQLRLSIDAAHERNRQPRPPQPEAARPEEVARAS